VEPTCEGDAIQCAQLKQTWLINCGKSVEGNGDCANELVCEGDAIVCAGLKMQKDGLCAWEKERVLSDLHDFATMNGIDLMPMLKPDHPSFNTEVNLPALVGGVLDAPGPVAGSCPPDIQVPLLRGTVAVPMQIICDFALILRPYMIIIGTFYGAFAFIRIGFVG